MVRRKDNNGFTLVEMIVVIVILAILVGITIGGIFGYVRKARISIDVNNAKVIEDTLQVLAVNKSLSENKYPNAIHYLRWTDAQTFNSDGTLSSSGKTAYWTGHYKGDQKKRLHKALSELLPDGLPSAKYANHFTLYIRFDSNNNITSITCTPYSSKEDKDETRLVSDY